MSKIKEKFISIISLKNRFLSRFGLIFSSLSNWLTSFFKDLSSSKSKFSDLVDTNYKLGLNHLRRDNIVDAKFRFKMVLRFQPSHLEANYYMAKALLMDNETTTAIKHLNKVLKINPDFFRAKYCLDQINNPEKISTIPLDIVLEKYIPVKDNYGNLVESQEGRIVIENQSKLKEEMADFFFYNLNDATAFLNLLDIQCSDGFVGKFLDEKKVLRKAIGLELYDVRGVKSLDLTNQNDELIYEKVIPQEIREFLSNNDEKFSCVFMPTTMCHFGDLRDILYSLKEICSADAFINFSIIPTKGEKDYDLDVMCNLFYHNVDYVIKCLKDLSFKDPYIKKFEQVDGVEVIIFSVQTN